MTALTRDQIRKFAPSARADLIEILVNNGDQLEAAGINTLLRVQHFMAQIATETGGLKSIEENLNYSAERLREVWPKRFPNLTIAKQYARNPRKLANFVYGTRLGNKGGDDGWRYRGSGLLQTTGLSNYLRAGYAENPDALRTPGPALTSALKFWVDNNCNSFADRDDIVGLRKRINGGTHGLTDARNYLAKAKRIFIVVDVIEKAAAPKLSKARIEELQNQLLRLGYIELGLADGLMGGKTIGAISMFQADHGLDINGTFDDETIDQIYIAEPRVVTRTSDTPTDPTILKAARTLKKGALGVMGAAGIGVTDPLSMIEGLRGYGVRVKEAIAPFEWATHFVQTYWMFILAAAAAGLFYYGRRIEKVTIEQHLTGRTA